MPYSKSAQLKWQLPPSIDDLLPPAASKFYDMQHKLLALIRKRGYKLVYPPMVEYAASLNIQSSPNLQADLALLANSGAGGGKTLGLRADFTPQAARIDARLTRGGSEVTRLCYGGETFRMHAGSQSHGRSGFHLGAELFGDKTLASDLEIIELALQCLRKAGIRKQPILFLSHATFAKDLLDIIGLRQKQEYTREYMELLARKSKDHIGEFIRRVSSSNKVSGLGGLSNPDGYQHRILQQLPRLYGDESILVEARKLIAPVRDELPGDPLGKLAKVAKNFNNEAEIYIDLGEMPGNGYSYHNGLVFGVYFDGYPHCLAEGGRYDAIGAQYNHSSSKAPANRGATGFSIDAKRLFDYLS